MIGWSEIKIRNIFFPSVSEDKLEVYPNMTVSDISLLLNETWNRPFQYEPWVGFKESPRTGRFVNISSEGFRYSYSRNLKLDSHGINIYVFGGSTTFGYGVNDASTIPAHLQKRLSNLHSDKSINVFNFGRGYYYSSQELGLLLQLLRNNYIPQVAIFIDGLNERLSVPMYSREMFALFDAYNYSIMKMFNMAIRRYIEKASSMRIVRNLMGFDLNKSPENYRDPKEIYEEYLKNKEIITLLSDKYGFSSYFFIQPVPGYRNKFSTTKFTKKPPPPGWIQHLTKRMELLEKTVDNQRSFSMTDLLGNYALPPFVDDCHYTSDVCDIIASFIAQKIKISHDFLTFE